MLKEFRRYLHDRFDKKGRLASASIILGEPVDGIHVTYVGFAIYFPMIEGARELAFLRLPVLSPRR